MDVLTSKSSQIYPREKLAHGVQHQMHFKSRYNSATKVFETKILNKQRIIFVISQNVTLVHHIGNTVRWNSESFTRENSFYHSETVCLIYNILLKLNLIKKINLPTQPCLVHTSGQCMYSPLAAQRVFQLQQIRWGTPMKFWNWFGSKIINLPTLGLGFSIASRKISGRNCETEREESWWYFAVLLQRPSHLSYPSRHYHYYNAIQAVCCINIH